MFSKKFLNISDFAKISGVSRQTLIYYDRLGLFSPAYVANNKYRMYSHNQVDTIGVITLLSDLGVPLKEIKRILTDISVETMTKTLNYQSEIIQEKIEKLTLLRDMIQIRLEQLKEGADIQRGVSEFCIKELDCDIPICTGNEINLNQDDIGDETIIDFFEAAEKKRLPLIFSFGFIKNADDILRKDYGMVSHMWFRLKNKKYANAFIPRGKYIVGYIKGDYGKTDQIYDDLLEFASKMNTKITGSVYEEYLIDELSEKNPDNYLMKAFVKIK